MMEFEKNNQTNDLVAGCQQFLEEMKARQIEVIPVDQHSLFDTLIVATCTSSRHLKATAQHLVFSCKKDFTCLGKVESSENWTAIDLGTLVVHLFLEDSRHHYDLESLWSSSSDQIKEVDNTERKWEWETKKLWDH